MKEFKGKKVLEYITARLVPPDSTYPDAICYLIMTEDIFYVIEDEDLEQTDILKHEQTVDN